MANTSITLVDTGGIYVPSISSVPVVKGDSVTFSTSDGTHVVLFFSPDAASVLSPNPGKAFALAAGKKAIFTFTGSQPGAHSAFFASHPGAAPAAFPSAVSEVLTLQTGPGREAATVDFDSGTGGTTKPGS
jgi:plastocyanin